MNKGRRIIWILHHSKPLWAVFSLFISLLLIVGSTYSWITYSEERINKVKPNQRQLSTVIQEKFEPNLIWAPGVTTTKELSVKNNGQTPAIVRLSLFEVFASFEVDIADGSGNGNLKKYTATTGTDFDKKYLETWNVGNTYKIADQKYWKVANSVVNNPDDPKSAYQYNGSRNTLLSYITLNFNKTNIQTQIPPVGTKKFWLYEEGYFYYSEILEPGQETVKLLNSVSLAEKAPNRYKGSVYQLIPVMDGHDRSKSLLKDWNLSAGPVYTMYQALIE